jgi:hypothetical protein
MSGIPFMITQSQEAQLRERGFTPEQIANMTPMQAQENLCPAVSASGRLLAALEQCDGRVKRRVCELLGVGPTSAAPLLDNDDLPKVPLPAHLLNRSRPPATERFAASLAEGTWAEFTPTNVARLHSALSAIPAISRDVWLHVGMALHSTGWPNAPQMWDTWSRTCPKKYNEVDQERTWQSFGRRRDGSLITVATVYRLAQDNRWSDDQVPVQNTTGPATAQPAEPNGQRESAAQGRDSTITAAALRTMTFPPVRYLLPGYIPEGVTLLVGRPKVGKSWLALDLCLACASGWKVLGNLTPLQGDVLYLALEDGKRRLKRRIDKLMPLFQDEWPERLMLAPVGTWTTLDQGGLKKIEEWCRSVPEPRLVVIDTLQRIRPPANGKAPLYGADYDAITGLQKLATEFGIAIVVLHHDRKADAEDAFDTVSGTLGLTGAADTILILKRRRNGVVLHARGRDIEESETAMQFDKETCRWTILGAAADVHRSNERARVIGALREAGQALKVAEIMIEAELVSRNAADLLLGKMVKDGEIVRIKTGVYGLPSQIRTDRTDGQMRRPSACNR